MTRPYMKHKRKRQRQTNKMPFLIIAVVFLGSITGLLAYSHYKSQFTVAEVKEMAVGKVASYFPHMFHKSQEPTPAKKVKVVAQDTVKPIHFDFYDELPKADLEFAQNQPAEEEAAAPITDAEDLAEADAAPKEPAVKKAVLASTSTAPVSAAEPAKQPDESNKIEQNIEQELAADLTSIKSSDNTSYILHLSTFRSQDAANRYRSALASAGLKANIVKLRRGRDLVYQLQQGPYRDLNQLKAMKKRFTERGIACEIRKASPYDT